MFRYTVIVVGRMKNRSLAVLCQDFAKRLNRMGSFELVELKDGDVASESTRILAALEKRLSGRLYVLAEEGRTQSTASLSAELAQLQGEPAVFVIGGAYGLSDAVKRRADVLLSLSPLTFTHEIARMLLCEQLYRVASIQSGSKYHHE